MSGLESGYRKALRWYPSEWREANEEAIVGVLLDGAEGRSTPRVGEILNLAAHGLLARFPLVRDFIPAGVRDAASSLALGFGFGLTLVILVMQEWAPWATSTLVYPQPETVIPVAATMLGPFAGWGAVVYLLWMLAAVVYSIRLISWGRIILFATVLVSIALVIFVDPASPWGRPPSLSLAVLASLTVIVAMGRAMGSTSHRIAASLAALAAISVVLLPIVIFRLFDVRFSPRVVWAFVTDGRGWGGTLILALGILFTLAVLARLGNWAGAIALLHVPVGLVAFAGLAQRGEIGWLVLGGSLVVIGLAVYVIARRGGYRLALVRDP